MLPPLTAEDRGVLDQTTGKWLMRVAADPRPGQYVFDGGRYTFAADDAGHVMYIVGDPPPVSSPLTAEEITELRLLDKVADPAPWEVHDDSRRAQANPNNEDIIVAARNAIPRLLDEVERSRALLKRIEWSALKDHTYSACPECGGIDTKFHDHEDDPVGHESGCELAALIGDAK